MDAEVQIPTTMEFDIKVAKEESPFESILVELFIQTHVKRGTDCNIDLNIILKRDGTEYTELLVTTRIDNSSVVIKRQPMTVETFVRLMTVLKVFAGLDTAKNRGQLTGYITGRLVYGTRSPKIEMRCHLIPTGRKRISSASIRFQSQHETNFTVKTVGFFTSDEKKLNLHVFNATDGIIIICGRVNCGKNTTLIAFINKLKELHPDKRIIMIEDPIEQTLDGVIQFQIDATNKDFGFAYFLKEALRHDPDIITVGETRDSESAKLVLDAASAGHLTLTTVHSTDSVKAIERMNSLTGDVSKLSDSLRAIISQKLVKTICSKCVREVDSNIPYIERLDDYIAKIGWQGEVQFVRGTGKTSDGLECRQCHGTGLHGRTGIFEILTFSEKMRDLIAKNSPVSKLRQLAIKEGLKSLFLNGLTKVLMGEITLAQLIKQTGPPNAEKEGISFACNSDSSDELN
jgi:type II secretory ATPase GspE/PulE/Tfp pilus assembly ATPase PilB-like protein